MSGRTDFVHLHLHTTYSFLDGALRPADAMKRAVELGMPAIAITDHGNMFGAVAFYQEAKKAGLKAIVGAEVYLAHGGMKERKPGTHHLVLLARNQEGYRNLIHLITKGYLEGYYRHPRVDKELLAAHAGGLIALSGCLAGEVQRSFIEQGKDVAVRAASAYAEVFGRDSFFLEIQRTGKREQDAFNAEARDIARLAGAGIVATNDVHYLDEEDYLAHQVLVCIGTGKQLSQEDRLYSEKLDIFMRSGAQMLEALPEFPDAIENTLAIAGRCDLTIELGRIRLPTFTPEDGSGHDEYLERIAAAGLEERLEGMRRKGLPFDEKAYRDRLAGELAVIGTMGFSSYFLIVWDFIAFARKSGIPVGPGRGSGGGSLAAYALRITDIDPIRYDLLFERFLNPERVSMPDFDIDFCKDRRDDVLRYVTQKYGTDHVAQIATFHQLKSKLVIRDVGRVLGLGYGDVDRIAKLIPPPVQGKTVTIDEALTQEPKLKALYNESEQVRQLLDLSRKLEGLTRHAGTHAAGVVISDRPLAEYSPLYMRAADNGAAADISTQYDKDVIEKIGLVKFDFLGLKTLTVLRTALELINAQARERGEPLLQDAADIPFDDAETFELISSGDTTGVFQLESRGFRDLLRRLRPRRLEDIIAAVALYRPGPLQSGMADDYIQRKNGTARITDLHPLLTKALEETYGVMVYQEQVMQVARLLAGFSLGEADNLRRAMSKKKHEEMARLRDSFCERSAARGVKREAAADIYEKIKEFADYAFNKSHSAGYAIIAYETAYFKTHYPVEFLAALMTCDEDRIDKCVVYLNEGRAKGIRILAPDVNGSGMHFTVVSDASARFGKAIRFGMRGVKGVGQAAIEAVLKGREEGPFVDLYDFCARVDLRSCNKATLEQLIRSGAFDSIAAAAGIHRARLFAALDAAMEHGRIRMKDRLEGQQDLLGLMAAAGAGGGGAAARRFTAAEYPAADQLTFRQALEQEKQALGCYVTGHPLEKFKADIERFASDRCRDVQERPAESQVILAGVVEGLKERPTRSGRGKVAFFSLEDLTGRVEVFMPPQVVEEQAEKLRKAMEKGDPVLVSGTVEHADYGAEAQEGAEERAGRVVMRSFEPLEGTRVQRTRQVHLYVRADEVQAGKIEKLRKSLLKNPGESVAFLHVRIQGGKEVTIRLPDTYKVSPGESLFDAAHETFPGCTVDLR